MTMQLAFNGAASPPLPAIIGLLDEAVQAIDHDLFHAKSRIIAVHDLLVSTLPRMPEAKAGGLAPWQAKRVGAYVDAHLEDAISNGELAELVRLSPGHFCKAFRVTFGVTPHAYVMRRRVEAAARQMTGTDESLAVIAVACGFTDQAHLGRIFLREKGMTPAVWRRRHFNTAMVAA